MSWRAAGIIKGLTENLTRSEKFVLLTLADYYNEETGRCDPSTGRLAAETIMSERNLVRVNHSLEEKGFIRIRDRHQRHRTNQYDLLCLSTDLDGHGRTEAGDMVSPTTRHGVTRAGDIGVTRTVSKNRNSSESETSSLPPHREEDEDDFLNKYSSFYTTLLGSSLFASAVVAPGPYFRTLQKQGDQPPPVDFEVVLDTMRWIYSAFNAHPQRLAQKLTVPAPSYLAGLAAVWPVLDKERIGPQTLSLVLHRVCEERGVSLSADKILAQVGTHPDSFIEAIEQLVASVS